MAAARMLPALVEDIELQRGLSLGPSRSPPPPEWSVDELAQGRPPKMM